MFGDFLDFGRAFTARMGGTEVPYTNRTKSYANGASLERKKLQVSHVKKFSEHHRAVLAKNLNTESQGYV